jgi:hypothetical protein
MNFTRYTLATPKTTIYLADLRELRDIGRTQSLGSEVATICGGARKKLTSVGFANSRPYYLREHSEDISCHPRIRVPA